MKEKKMNRQELLEQSNRLFRKKGYSNTSIADIAAACQLSKGSVYHYISSKKGLALEVLKQQQERYTEQLFNIAYDDKLSLTERLKNFCETVSNLYQESQGCSVIIQLAMESSDVLAEYQSVFKTFFKQWLDAVKHMLSAIMPSEHVDSHAQSIVSDIQGSIILSFIFADDAILTNALKRLEQSAG